MMDTLFALARGPDPATPAVKWPAWKTGSEQLVEFGDAVALREMNTPRLARD
jgi:hypothetical protein